VQYDRHSGHLQSTELGRIASDYYIGHHTMSIYSEHLKPTLGDIDLLRLFAMSGEFKHMRVREEERLELLRLADRVPIPIKESLDEPAAKVNVLLQAYVSNLKLDGLALAADTVYVTQSAARLARALLQLAIEKKWANLMGRCLNLYKAVSKRQWTSQTPLRQFIPAVSDDLLRRIERKDLDFDRYYDLSTAELGEMLRNPTMGKIVHRLVHSLPRMEVQVTRVQPITRALLRIDISLSTDFRFDSNPKIHGSGESFWVWIEDADSESILHIEPFYLRSSLAGEEDFTLTFMVPVTNPSPPQYFVRCVSDRWITPEISVPISFHDLILPEKFPPHTELLELQPLAVRDAFFASGTPEEGIKDFAAYQESLAGLLDYYTKQFEFFNPIQTQAFGTLFKSDGNCVLCAPPGSGRLICAELALARLFARQPTAAAVFIAGRGNLVVGRRCAEIQQGIGKALGLVVGELTGESSADIALLRQPGVVVVATPEKWDMFSRRWQLKREGRVISMVQLFVLDDAHLLGETAGHGAVIEVVGSRMRYIAAQAIADGSSPCRIVAILDPVANAKDFGQWLGATPTNVLSFAPSARPVPLEVHIERAIFRAGGGVAGTASALVLPVLRAIRKYIGDSSKPIVVFVASRRLARSLALEIVTMTAGEGDPDRFLHSDNTEFSEILDKIRVENLRECISKGVGYVHESMPIDDIRATELLFRAGSIQVLVSTANYCWKSAAITGYLTVIAGTSTEETGGLAFCRAEYSLSELWHMIGRAGRPMLDSHGECVILTEQFLVSRYKTLLEEPLPVESQLDSVLADQINAEVAAKVVHTKQQAIDFLTWTMFYRRLPLNPNYYSMSGNSHRLMQDHLSDLIEDALSVLESSKCVATVGDEDMDLGALNLGLIASHYYVRHATVELFASQITAKTKLRGLLGLLASAREYDSLPIRPGDTDALKKLSARVPYAVPSIDGSLPSFSDPYTKTHLLLQSHLSRLAFAGDLSDDREFVVGQAVRLLRALVDVIASAGWLEPAISAMELCQLIVQGMWDTDPTVAQLPHLEVDLLSVLQEKYDVTTVDALLEMDEQDRTKAFSKLSRGQVNEIAAACNSFPDLKQISAVPADNEVAPGARVFVHVVLERDSDENDDMVPAVPFVTAPRYPTRKEEGWWVVVGDPTSNTLLSLKYVALSKRARVKLEITAPLVPGNYNLELYLMSDSYVLDCDQQDVFALTVVSGDGGNDKDVTE
jgi:pre-mRNA-splicing helicase BRR2